MRRTYLARIIIILILIICEVFIPAQPGSANSASQDNVPDDVVDEGIQDLHNQYLPVVVHRELIDPRLSYRRINAPYFNVVNVTDEKLAEMAIAWFGQITPTSNYTDIRVGYNDEALYVHLEVFDRLLWYDKTPEKIEFNNWDSATLYLSIAGNSGTLPNLQAYRFDAQLSNWEDREAYQAAYRGNGSGWEYYDASFETISGWRGNALNDIQDDRGWGVNFKIPFLSILDQLGPPINGTIWGMGITLHDRDDEVGTPIELQSWPINIDGSSPSTWGQLHFGLPLYSPPNVTPSGSTTICHKLNGIVVQDEAVGGTTGNLCPGDSYFIWNLWGNMNFVGASDFNIQNQADVADWPCFSKYYINFPLDSIPAGKVIISAKLTLFQFGNSGDLNDPDPRNRPRSSLIQVLSAAREWSESTISWNNAPQAFENLSQAWVSPLEGFPGWPGVAHEWEVSYAVAQAYSANQPLNLVLYEADAARHSGKYFSSSDTGDWNENGRPSIVVTWGDP
jgi:hypothetical protein